MNKSIIVVGGCFDILHMGHIKFLKRAKNLGDYLVILLESDKNVKKMKGDNRPVFNQKARKEMLESLKFVDEVIILPNNVNYKTYENLIKKIRPNIIVVTSDDPIKDKKLKQAKSVNATLKTIKKYNSPSTSEIIKLLDF